MSRPPHVGTHEGQTASKEDMLTTLIEDKMVYLAKCECQVLMDKAQSIG